MPDTVVVEREVRQNARRGSGVKAKLEAQKERFQALMAGQRQRAKRFGQRAFTRAAAAGGGYVGALLHGKKRLMEADGEPGTGIDAVEVAGGLAAAVTLMGRDSITNEVIGNAGAAAAGASKGMRAALEKRELYADYIAAVDLEEA